MQRIQGFTEQGNTTLLITGAPGTITRKVQGSFPGATITVFLAGTVTLAPIYADNASVPTAKANPFVSSTDGTWFFYAADGRYDVRFSGGGIAVPFTIGDLWTVTPSNFVIDVTASPFLADKTGVSDVSGPVNAAFAAATALGGGIVWFPAGTYRFVGTTLPGANTTIKGAGPGATVLTAGDNVVMFSLRNSHVRFEGLTFNVTVGVNTTRCIQFDAVLSNVWVDECEFIGNDKALSIFALTINGHDLTNLFVNDCTFTRIAYVIIKDNADLSVTRGTFFHNISINGTAAGININHPGATGSWTQIEVTNVTCIGGTHDIGWYLAFSGIGVSQGQVTNFSAVGANQEALHIEDGAHMIALNGGSIKKLGNTIANHGLLQIIGNAFSSKGSNNISVHGYHFDLTDPGSPLTAYGIYAENGGLAFPPQTLDITGNTFDCRTGNQAIVIASGYNSRLSNIYRNPDPLNKAATFVDCPAQHFESFNESFYNPAVLFHINDDSFGVITHPHIFADNGDLNTGLPFAFINGNTGPSTSVCFRGFTITRAYTADNVPTQNVLFPAGSMLNGKVALRFEQNGGLVTFIATADLLWDGTSWTTANVFAINGTSPAFTSIAKTGANFTSAAAKVVPATGLIVASFEGVLFP